MAVPKIKATYSLDPETVGALERVAEVRAEREASSERGRRLRDGE